jgi:hypothetical protein
LDPMKCLLCGGDAKGNLNGATRMLVIECDSCGYYEVTSNAKHFYFDHGKLDHVALEKLRLHIKKPANSRIIDAAKIHKVTGIESGSHHY